VRALAEHHLVGLEERIRGLQEMADVVQRLIEACKGDERPDCPILDELSGGNTRPH
jgi:hypothetical protein